MDGYIATPPRAPPSLANYQSTFVASSSPVSQPASPEGLHQCASPSPSLHQRSSGTGSLVFIVARSLHLRFSSHDFHARRHDVSCSHPPPAAPLSCQRNHRDHGSSHHSPSPALAISIDIRSPEPLHIIAAHNRAPVSIVTMAAFTQRDVENVMRTIFRRCVKCETQAPSCAGLNCGSGTICVQTPPSCDNCATVTCKPDPSLGGNTNTAKTNVGAIAGGVIGGVVFVSVLVFVIWKFCLKGKRQQYQEGDWQEVDMSQQEKVVDTDFTSRRSARASTHTVASMASSVLTRASNIIQIAYIPGVTNRSGPGSPDLLVPPVPPIPAMSPSSGLSSPYANSEQHFFVPDLTRDSMASTTTGGRSSFARASMAPSLARNSVASTVYRQNAIVSPLPAQTIVRGKAAVVSVKSNGSSPSDTPGLETPPVPQIDSKFSTNTPVRVQMPRMASGLSPQNSVRSTATLGPVRALNITKKKASDSTPPKSSHSNMSGSTSETLVNSGRPITEISVASSDDGVAHARARKAVEAETSDSESDDDDHSRARRSLLRDSQITDINDTPISMQSPFSDYSTIDSRPDMPQRHTSNSSGLRAPMTPIVEEGSKRASLSNGSKRTQSPFSDDNKSDL
ncbi:hypothetical protein K458DRAFT_390225 [Lentithecium fluviatile CBS 122367]|uniref:Membrane anchor Opy2 N-terminal domain-containing protein n=1 Tax=Lentithecium fluviatile CBS 122367 TaxID=1168545 RepID=A0A6G1IYI0_9PLEO|nr:hypothetical protein K458DRAFT_390225 [Lentithecium fluviatile CBS 122367]